MDTKETPPSLGDVAVAARRLAAHRAAGARDRPIYRDSAIGAACLIAALAAWPRGPGPRDVEAARARAEQAAIREVLGRDEACAQEAAQGAGFLDQYWDGSALVSGLASRMDAIDLSGCPQDFQAAYKKHVLAWASVAQVKASNEGFSGAIKGFFTAGFSMLPAMSDMDRALGEVRSSWSEVQQAAIRRGVAP
jgi:hypothetical protein